MKLVITEVSNVDNTVTVEVPEDCISFKLSRHHGWQNEPTNESIKGDVCWSLSMDTENICFMTVDLAYEVYKLIDFLNTEALEGDLLLEDGKLYVTNKTELEYN